MMLALIISAAQTTAVRNAKAKLIVFSAPSGAGKTTLTRELVSRGFATLSVSHTTRKPHSSETDGVDYWFVSCAEFSRLRDSGKFLEHAKVHGNCYGTSRMRVENQLRSGKSVLLELDTSGSAQIRNCPLPSLHVFILPPSLPVLEARLRARARDEPESIRRRLRQVRTELACMNSYDYLIVNDSRKHAVHDAIAIVDTAAGGGNILPERAQRARALETGNRQALVAKWRLMPGM